MILTIDIQDSAFDKVMYLLNNLKDDVKIVKGIDVEVVSTNDSDYKYFETAKQNRLNGEKLHSIDDIIKEFE